MDFSRFSSNGIKNPALNPEHRESVIYRLHPEHEGRQLIYQMGTADPDTAVEAAKLVAPYVAGIDVNAGCPKPFSTTGGMGAALLKTPDRLCAILRALVKHVGEAHEIGISVKIRLLDTPAETEDLVRKLCATGITGLTIHCRTTPMRPRERAIREQLRMIGNVCREAGVACLMNGDVTSRAEALQLAAEYGVDGAMIATAAETNPSCFRPDDQGGKATWDQVVEQYVQLAMEVENRWGNTKYLLGQMIPGKNAASKIMQATKSYSELVKAMGWAGELEDLARKADSALDIGEFEKPKMTKAERKAMNKATANVAPSKTKASSTQRPAQKRKADEADLDVNRDAMREMGPATVPEQASVLAV